MYYRAKLLTGVIFLLCAYSSIYSQTIDFSFQGKLYENGAPVATPRDMIFRLWNETNSTQIGTDIVIDSVSFNNGVFTVWLNFGSTPFDGSVRYIETLVSLPGTNDYTTLAPRQRIRSSPYSIRSVYASSAETATSAITADNSIQLGGIGASQYVLTNDPRLANARIPLAGSQNYIQNQNGAAQPNSNFYISGTGRAGLFTATNVGVNTVSPTAPLEVSGRVYSSGTQAGFQFSDRGQPAGGWTLYSSGFEARLNIGGVDRLALSPTGLLSISNLASASSTHVCWDSSAGYFSFCSSSIRFKTNVENFENGAYLLRQLRPVSFDWKTSGQRQLGFIAEEVGAVSPILTFKNKNGQIEGVNYDQITTILVNVVKDQQEILKEQEQQINEMKLAICEIAPQKAICNRR